MALAESAFAGGPRLHSSTLPDGEAHRMLFSESPSRAVVSCSPGRCRTVLERRPTTAGVEAASIGTTGGDELRTSGSFDVGLDEAHELSTNDGCPELSSHRVRLMAGEARDACGVVGIYAPGEDVARLTYYALYALQHRGQESAGIAISDGQTIVVYKELGLVSQVFDETVLQSLRGHLAIGHTRYSTTGSTTWENAQPIVQELQPTGRSPSLTTGTS